MPTHGGRRQGRRRWIPVLLSHLQPVYHHSPSIKAGITTTNTGTYTVNVKNVGFAMYSLTETILATVLMVVMVVFI